MLIHGVELQVGDYVGLKMARLYLFLPVLQKSKHTERVSSLINLQHIACRFLNPLTHPQMLIEYSFQSTLVCCGDLLNSSYTVDHHQKYSQGVPLHPDPCEGALGE